MLTQAQIYLDGTMITILDQNGDFLRSDPTGSIKYSKTVGNGFVFYAEDETREILQVPAFDTILDQNGDPYGSTEQEVIQALNAFLNFKIGGGVGNSDYLVNTVIEKKNTTVLTEIYRYALSDGAVIGISAEGIHHRQGTSQGGYQKQVIWAVRRGSNVSLNSRKQAFNTTSYSATLRFQVQGNEVVVQAPSPGGLNIDWKVIIKIFKL